MNRFEAVDRDVEINGQTILATLEGVRRFSETYKRQVRDALADSGIDDPEAGEWYPQQAWLDAFGVLAAELEPHLLDRIGEQIPETAEWPTGLSTVEEALESIDVAYQQNHRGGEIGHYRVTDLDDRMGVLRCENPYPCPFDRGIIRAITQRFAPAERLVFVEETGDECRREHGDFCEYTVYW
jgi:hypothetical protein